jgi:hypothetical protein
MAARRWLAGLGLSAGFGGLYLAQLSTIDLAEVVVAIAIGLVAAAAAGFAARAGGASYAPRARWASWLAWLPVAIVRDTVSVIGFAAVRAGRIRAARGRGSDFDIESFDQIRAGSRDEADGPAWRAYATLVLSTAPGTYVAEIDHAEDPERDVLIVHRVGDIGPLERLCFPGDDPGPRKVTS